MSEYEGYAFVTHVNKNGVATPYVIHFPEGRLRFQQWVADAPSVPMVDVETIKIGNETKYLGMTQANVFVIYVPEGGQREFAMFTMSDIGFGGWLQFAETQEHLTYGSGRRPQFVQQLKTWKLWAKKAGAKY